MSVSTEAISSIMTKVEMGKHIQATRKFMQNQLTDFIQPTGWSIVTKLQVFKAASIEFPPSNGKKNHIFKCKSFAISIFFIIEEMASEQEKG